jgi:hypothetical protein
MEATTQYFGKWFFINRSKNFIAILNFYVRHLGVKITGPYCPSWCSLKHPTYSKLVFSKALYLPIWCSLKHPTCSKLVFSIAPYLFKTGVL